MISILNLIQMGCVFVVFIIVATIVALGFYLVDLDNRAERCEHKGGTYIKTVNSHKCVDLKEIK